MRHVWSAVWFFRYFPLGGVADFLTLRLGHFHVECADATHLRTWQPWFSSSSCDAAHRDDPLRVSDFLLSKQGIHDVLELDPAHALEGKRNTLWRDELSLDDIFTMGSIAHRT